MIRRYALEYLSPDLTITQQDGARLKQCMEACTRELPASFGSSEVRTMIRLFLTWRKKNGSPLRKAKRAKAKAVKADAAAVKENDKLEKERDGDGSGE